MKVHEYCSSPRPDAVRSRQVRVFGLLLERRCHGSASVLRLICSTSRGRLQIAYYVDNDGDQDRVVGERKDGVPEDHTTAGAARNLHVGCDETRADGEGEVGEIEHARFLITGKLQTAGVLLVPVVRVGVVERVG